MVHVSFITEFAPYVNSITIKQKELYFNGKQR